MAFAANQHRFDPAPSQARHQGWLTWSLVLVFAWGTAAAQTPAPPATVEKTPSCGAANPAAAAINLKDEAWCAASAIERSKRKGDPDPAQEFTGFAESLISVSIVEALAGIDSAKVVDTKLSIVRTMEETKRTDKQTGASARAEGSTTVAEKANFANLLSLAVENGTIQQASNGTTLTLSSSPYALTAWAHGDTATNYKKHQDLVRVGIAATFNISNQQDILSNATRKQLAEWSVRVRLSGDNTTRSKDFEKYFEDNVAKGISKEAMVLTNEMAHSLRGQATKVENQVEDKFYNTTDGPPLRGTGYIKTYLDQHASETGNDFVVGLRDEIVKRLQEEVIDHIDNFGFDAATRERIKLTVARDLLQAHEEAKDALSKLAAEIERLNGKPVYSLAYTNVRDTATSDYSVVKFLLEKGTSSSGKLVFNAGSSFYSKPDRTKNEQTVRDYATALSWEAQLGRSPLVLNDVDQGQMTLSFAGRYQRLLENRHQAGKKADIAVVQVKFEIPVFSGVTFPLSVSYATASELIKEDHVHANFGFSFDTDKLYQLLAFKKKQGGVQ